MRITLPQCMVVAAIGCLTPGCDRDTETQRHGDKVNDQVEYHSYVQRMKKRLAEADRRIESLENSIEKRTKSAKHDAQTQKDVDKDQWRVSLDDIKKLRTDVGKLG